MTDDLDLDRMKEVASAAPQTTWCVSSTADVVFVHPSDKGTAIICDIVDQGSPEDDLELEYRLGDYIAMFDPPTVLFLIERLEKAEAEVTTLRADFAEAVEAVARGDDALGEAEAVLGGEYGETSGYLCDVITSVRSSAARIVAKHKEPTHG